MQAHSKTGALHMQITHDRKQSVPLQKQKSGFWFAICFACALLKVL